MTEQHVKTSQFFLPVPADVRTPTYHKMAAYDKSKLANVLLILQGLWNVFNYNTQSHFKTFNNNMHRQK